MSFGTVLNHCRKCGILFITFTACNLCLSCGRAVRRESIETQDPQSAPAGEDDLKPSEPSQTPPSGSWRDRPPLL